MDPRQQQLLAEILQQSGQNNLNLKGYEVALEQLQQQIRDQETKANNFWSASFSMQRNGIIYPSVIQNLNSSIISSVPTCEKNQVFSAFSPMMNTNYLPTVASNVTPLLNIPFVNKMASFMAPDEPQKKLHTTKLTWQNLMRRQEMQLSQLITTTHKSHQQVPPVSRLAKKRISESQQQHQEGVKIPVKVIMIENKDVQPTPCCSSNDASKIPTVKKLNRSEGKIKKRGSNIYGKRKGRNIKYSVNNYNDKDENDDSEDGQYIDVETVEEKLDTKEQKKALIEFYRKVKTIRMSYEREDLLICQMCEQKVQNSDSLILIHLYGHAEVMPYRCKMCGATECQLERIYAHIRQGHPNKDPSITYENRRNMAQLICLLRTCFPRNISKTKAAYSDLIDKICAVAKQKSLVKLTCMVCARKFSTRKKCLMRHAQTHLHYRCKNCGIISFDEATIIEHYGKKHYIMDPQRTTHYDTSEKSINTSENREIALKNCFGNILNKEE